MQALRILVKRGHAAKSREIKLLQGYEKMKLNAETIRGIKDSHVEWLATDGRFGRRADFRYADLSETIELYCADLSFALMTGANLTRCYLIGVNFTGAILADVCFKEANLCSADMSHSIMTRANLASAFIENVDVKGADMFCCNLYNTDKSKVKNWFLARNTTACIYDECKKY